MPGTTKTLLSAALASFFLFGFSLPLPADKITDNQDKSNLHNDQLVEDGAESGIRESFERLLLSMRERSFSDTLSLLTGESHEEFKELLGDSELLDDLDEDFPDKWEIVEFVGSDGQGGYSVDVALRFNGKWETVRMVWYHIDGEWKMASTDSIDRSYTPDESMLDVSSGDNRTQAVRATVMVIMEKFQRLDFDGVLVMTTGKARKQFGGALEDEDEMERVRKEMSKLQGWRIIEISFDASDMAVVKMEIEREADEFQMVHLIFKLVDGKWKMAGETKN